MQSNFARAMSVELKFEGGKVDDPQDPGGRTNQGITQAVYSAWRANNGKPVQDVFLLADDERDSIYRLQYADKIKFDALPSGLDLVMLDGAINSGPVQAVKWVQRALGASYSGRVDGALGEGTFAAIQACQDVGALIEATLDRRMAFLKALKTWHRFGRGWQNRVDQVRKLGLSWVGAPPLVPDVVDEHDDMHHKAPISDAKKIPSTAPGAGVGSSGGVLVGASAASQTFFDGIKAKLQTITFIPHMDMVSTYFDHVAATVMASLGITGIVAGAGGAAWFAYARHRAAKLHDALDTKPAASAPAGAAA